MCFQGFVHFACGCSKIEETECDLAADKPFYVKVACPDYSHETGKTPRACGSAGYFCKTTKEGVFLQALHETFDQSCTQLRELDARFTGARDNFLRFHRSADEKHISQELRKTHPAYNRVNAAFAAAGKEQNKANHTRFHAWLAINECKDFRNQRVRYIVAQNAAGQPVICPEFQLSQKAYLGLPEALQRQSHELGYAPQVTDLTNNVATTSETIDVSAPNLPQNDSQHSPTSSRRDASFITPRKPGHQEDGVTRLSPLVQDTHRSSVDPRKKRLAKRTMQQDVTNQSTSSGSPQKSKGLKKSNSVRRSSRVQKKVSYAESIGSAGGSREPSPVKSDGSGFSPSKSDHSGSPSKSEASPRHDNSELRREAIALGDNKARRSGSSLSNRMAEWKQRNRNAAAAAAAAAAGVSGNDEAPNPLQEYLQPRSSMTNLPNRPAVSASMITPSLADMLPRPHTAIGMHQPTSNILQGFNAASMPTLPAQLSFNLPFTDNPTMAPTTPGLATFSQIQPQAMPFDTSGMSTNTMANSATFSTAHGGGGINTSPNRSELTNQWLMNTPAFNNQVQAASSYNPYMAQSAGLYGRLPMSVSDSAIDTSLVEGFENTTLMTPQRPSYDQMHRSFSAASDLTPSHLALSYGEHTDPKKRSFRASSPTLSSNKHPRLSLPGEEIASVTSEQDSPSIENSAAASSPSKIPPYDFIGEQTQNQSPTALFDQTRPTPAPVLAPTAVMSVPPAQQNGGVEGEGELSSSHPPEHTSDPEAPEELTNGFADAVDWSLFNDDLL